MKISIVNPRIPVFQRNYAFRKTRRWQPLSTAIVAAWLEQQGGWEIQFLDAHVMDWSDAETVRRIHEFAPDVLYYSSERTDAWELPIPDLKYVDDFFVALFGGNADPGSRATAAGNTPASAAAKFRPAHVLFEGPHGSIYPADILRRVPQVDAVLRGETEPVSFAALGAIARGGVRPAATAPRGDWSAVKSVSWRRADGSFVHNPDEENPVTYADFPSPAWHLLDMSRYGDAAAPGVPFAMLETSRGCPMPCGYCYKQMFGDRQSKRKPEQVLDEVQEVVEKYGVRRIMFQDQIFTLDRRHTAAICEGLIQRGLAAKIEWRCQTRLNGMKNELLKLMHDAGCVELYTGLETGSDTIQGEISKLTLKEFLGYRDYGESIGLKISPNMILGLPGETYETAMESILFFHRLGIAMSPNVNITYPMTRYHTEAVERGELKGDSWDEVVMAAGLIGTHMDKATIDKVRAEAQRLNRVLRWKKRVYGLFGREYGRGAAQRLLKRRSGSGFIRGNVAAR
ncbi:MAG: B12-binding domain-containing radical SAM protein [Planctomycetota bacterium]